MSNPNTTSFAESRFGFKSPDPFGAKIIRAFRNNIWRFLQGETINFVISSEYDLQSSDYDVILTITALIDDTPVYQATYANGGLVEIPDYPNKVNVVIPQSESDHFARGSYMLHMRRTDKATGDIIEIDIGRLLIDYDANSPYPEFKYVADRA